MTRATNSVRAHLAKAEAAISAACEDLRAAGLPENANSQAVELTRLRIWTDKGGWLDHLEATRNG